MCAPVTSVTTARADELLLLLLLLAVDWDERRKKEEKREVVLLFSGKCGAACGGWQAHARTTPDCTPAPPLPDDKVEGALSRQRSRLGSDGFPAPALRVERTRVKKEEKATEERIVSARVRHQAKQVRGRKAERSAGMT